MEAQIALGAERKGSLSSCHTEEAFHSGNRSPHDLILQHDLPVPDFQRCSARRTRQWCVRPQDDKGIQAVEAERRSERFSFTGPGQQLAVEVAGDLDENHAGTMKRMYNSRSTQLPGDCQCQWADARRPCWIPQAGTRQRMTFSCR